METLEFIIKISLVSYVLYYLATHKLIFNADKEAVENYKAKDESSMIMEFEFNDKKMNVMTEKR